MNEDLRYAGEYSSRQVEAAHRVLIDVHQVLAFFNDSLVVVGGWVPELLIPNAPEAHIGSVDVDVALDAEKLTGGLYADLLDLSLKTRRYKLGERAFQLITEVDLNDNEPPVVVPVDFLASKEV